MDAKDIFESVCHIKSQSENDGGQGTGFFMFLNGKNYIVSNKHVICGNKFTRTQITLSTSITNNETLESTTCTNKFPTVQELLIKNTGELLHLHNYLGTLFYILNKLQNNKTL